MGEVVAHIQCVNARPFASSWADAAAWRPEDRPRPAKVEAYLRQCVEARLQILRRRTQKDDIARRAVEIRQTTSELVPHIALFEILEEFDDIIEREKYGRRRNEEEEDARAGTFQRLLYGLWMTGARQDTRRVAVKRGHLADIAGCSPRYVSEKVRVLKRYNLIDASRDGYMKLPKFIRLIRKLQREEPDFFSKEVVKDEIYGGTK